MSVGHLITLLAVVVGTGGLLYCIRKWGKSSRAEPFPRSLRSTTGEHGDKVSDTTSERTPCPKSREGEEVTRDLRMSNGAAEQSTAAMEEHTPSLIADGPSTRAESGVRPEEASEQSDFTVFPEDEQVNRLLRTPAQGEVFEELEASQDERNSPQNQMTPGESEPSEKPNAGHSLQSVETATTAVGLTDRPAKDYANVDVATTQEPPSARNVMAVTGATSTQDNEQPSGPVNQDGGDDTKEEPAKRGQLSRKKQARKKPRKYKGIARAAPQTNDVASFPKLPERERVVSQESSLPVQIRLRFDRGGFCNVSLLARKAAYLPEEITVSAPEGEVYLRAMQDEWYQDIVPDDISSVLRNGTVWTQEGENGQCTWSLSGRELYVLADRSDVSGYVSQPCLDLGRDHVILCTEPLRSRVEEAIRDAQAQPTTVLDQSFGIPPGWLVFRNVVPSAPVPPADDADIFNALRPLPRIKISLERGIRIRHANWLEGHPPSIRVYGDPEHASEVRIDGRVAERLADGAYRTSAWDAVGQHTVWCAGSSKSYQIVPFEASWELWDAYTFPVAVGKSQRLAICGPNVRAVSSEPWGSESFSVPESNPVLLGPRPGQIVTAEKASPLHGTPVIASPGFRPIWALPRDPFHCDKKTTRILCVAGSELQQPKMCDGGGSSNCTDAEVAQWARLILNAGRKGMTKNPDTEPVNALWHSYKRLARHIWRSRR